MPVLPEAESRAELSAGTAVELEIEIWVCPISLGSPDFYKDRWQFPVNLSLYPSSTHPQPLH